MISFKKMMVPYLVLGFSCSALTWQAQAQSSCDFKTVTNQCQFFKNLKPTDIIELANGEKVPACTLSSVFSAQAETALARAEEAQVALRDYIHGLPPSVMSSEFKSRLESLGYHNLGNLTYPNKNKLSLPWPPNQSGAAPKEVSIDELLAFWGGQQGLDRERFIAMVRASDVRVQRSETAISMDTRDRVEFLRTPAQTQAAFNQVKTEALAFLRQGRSDSELSPDMRSVIGRVEAYTLSNPGPSGSSPEICGPNRGQGGANNISRGFIDLGPKLNYFPGGTIQRTLAHEFAHAFDPCRSNVTLFKASDEFNRWVSTHQNVNNPRGVFGIAMPPNSEAQLMGSQVLGAPFSIDQNPFRETYNCLINQGEGRSGHSLNRGLGNFHKGTGEYLAQNGPVRTEAQACEFTQGNEIFCDWFAAQILEQIIKKNPPARPSPTRPLPEGVVAAPPGYEYMIYNLDEACAEEIAGDPLYTGAEHPSDRRRADLILNNPTVAEAMGCPRTLDSQVICPASETVNFTGERAMAPPAETTKPPKAKPQKKSEASTVE